MSATLRHYSTRLTAEINRKGVLDVDVVKGCSSGMAAHKPNGCYGACYAAATARFRGIDFSRSVTRSVDSHGHALEIEKTVRMAPYGFFRIGTMGDPSHDWDATVETVEWLAPYATPVIVTKHWGRATDEQMRALIVSGAVLNTSMSALDTQAELAHRIWQRARYAELGGHSVSRIVTCAFNAADPVGEQYASVQRRLLSLAPVIDNPLRVSRSHALVQSGVITLTVKRDLNTERTISIASHDAYVGHCAHCADLCGLGFIESPQQRPTAPQYELL